MELRRKGDYHSVYTADIIRGVKLTCVKTDKFKTGCISVSLVTGLRADTAAGYALIPRVLRRGTARLPDMERIVTALDDLYGARVEPLVRKKGELQCIGLYSDFPNGTHISGIVNSQAPSAGSGQVSPGVEDILVKTATLLGEVLLSPVMDDGALRAGYVESEKSNLIDDIRAAINDKRGYSISRLLEQMCAGEAFGVRRLGDEASAGAITPQTLTAHYRDILNNAQIEVFYCGAEEPDYISSVLHDAMQGLPKERINAEAYRTDVVLHPSTASPRVFEDYLDVAQGKLAIGFRLGKAMAGIPDYPAMFLFNTMFGAGDTSKLFLNIREKLSLCYSIGSILDKHKGVMVVSAGVDFNNLEGTHDEILAQLESIKKGEITDWEFTSARRSVIASIKQAMDRPGGLEELYFDCAVSAVPYDPHQLCEELESATLDRVVEFASDIATDSVYYLKGSGGVSPDDYDPTDDWGPPGEDEGGWGS